MNDFSDEAGSIELSSDFIGTVLGASEHNGSDQAAVTQQMLQRSALLLGRNMHNLLFDFGDSGPLQA